MKYVSPERIRRALVNLREWGDQVGQTRSHCALFLSASRMGQVTSELRDFREADDKDFWNSFMLLGGDSAKPFFDPTAGEFRPRNYVHNSAFKQRNDRWPEWGIAKRDGVKWQFEADYLEVLRSKSMTSKGSVHLFPEPDWIAWLYRSTPFDDAATYASARERFRSEFKLNEEEVEALFEELARDGESETDEQFFGKRKTPDQVVAELAQADSDLGLAELIQIVAERGEPEPVDVEDIVQLLKSGRGQVILQGPPGTGKTFAARQAAAQLLGLEPTRCADAAALGAHLAEHRVDYSIEDSTKQVGEWDIVQFHPNYSYEDFVRGISAEIEGDRPVFRAEDRVLGVLAKRAAEHGKPVVLIVDEINRGDISKVLGELIFALEYRGESVTTPYVVDGSARLTIPPNLYLIATMNTADRSIALIDYAIRRRFDFVDVNPSRHGLEEHLEQTDNGLEFVDNVLAVYDAVNQLLYGQPEYQIGHTYFMADDQSDMAERLVFQVLPLLAEYQREGLIGENSRLRPAGWPGDGIALTHPQPFMLCEQVENWL